MAKTKKRKSVKKSKAKTAKTFCDSGTPFIAGERAANKLFKKLGF